MQPVDLVTEVSKIVSQSRQIQPVYFTITEELVTKFSLITGDISHLHMTGEFARRSIFRQQVVHGMLPLSFVSLLNVQQQKEYTCLVKKLSCQFIKPVYIGDELILQGKLQDINDPAGSVRIAFTISKRTKDIEVLSGSIEVGFAGSSSPSFQNIMTAVDTTAGPECSQSEEVMELLLEKISVGDTDGFLFTVSEQSLAEFQEMLGIGVNDEKKNVSETLQNFFYLPDLLAISLFSTSVGVCIPGKHATFLAFEATVQEHLPAGLCGFLHGKVSHVSKGTRIIKKDLTITEQNGSQDKIFVSGNVRVLVNEPPVKMPTMKELKETSLDHGLNDKVVLVTGASRGIGETIAKYLALYGAKVVVNYFQGTNDATRVVEEIRSENGRAIAVQADVSDEEKVGRMINQVIQEYGEIDILVNNAVGGFKPVPFSRLKWEEAQKEIDIVIKGAFNCCKEVLPYMLEKGSGKIINIGTVTTDSPPPSQVRYVIAKSGLVGLTRGLSVEYAAKNIQVNMVVPSFVETDLVSYIPEVYRKKIAKDTPMGRNASPSDIAQAVFFLASSYSSFTTGQKIFVTGGGVPFS